MKDTFWQFSERVEFPTRKNRYTNRGILEAAGICYCDESTSCRCDTKIAVAETDPELRVVSRYHKPGNVEDPTFNYSAEWALMEGSHFGVTLNCLHKRP